MMQLKNGVFDDASISVIASETVSEISRLAGLSPDVRRFRPNIVVRLLKPVPFQEDEWLGGVLSFGQDDAAPAVCVITHDVRCSMVNLDPDHGESSAGSAENGRSCKPEQGRNPRCGHFHRSAHQMVGQSIFLRPAPENNET